MPTYLLAWNPDRWTWDNLDQHIEDVAQGEGKPRRWSTGRRRNIEVGDRVFLIRLGEDPRGIFGSGTVTEPSFQAPHWDPDRAAEGERSNHVRLRFDILINPEDEAPLPLDLLNNDPRFSEMHWSTQMSGVEIPQPIAETLERVWVEWNSGVINRYQSDSGRIFGHIPGYPPGSEFASRIELSQARVHRPNQSGISGSQYEGADSIVLSGGYEDDEDYGNIVIYTGEGGRDAETGEQIEDQAFEGGNKALAISAQEGYPVRVIRGGGLDSPYAPEDGYRYDGLYLVEKYWRKIGQSGHLVWLYELRKIDDWPLPEPQPSLFETDSTPERREATASRIIRNTQAAKKIKDLYDYTCQVCGVRLEGAAGPYAEGAHIRPLGRPHNGPDSRDNILCLCPNHHALFDFHGFAIADDFTLIGIDGQLTVEPQHQIDTRHLAYHREHYYSADS